MSGKLGSRVGDGIVKAAENWAEIVRLGLADPDFNPLGYPISPDERAASRLWPDNRITELEGVKNTYDGAGNLVEQKRPDGTRLHLSYDGAFRLTTLTRTNPDGTTTQAWYGYDAFSRRIAKGVTQNGTEKITRYGWDGDNLVHEATEETLTTILYPPGSFAPMMRVEQRVEKEGEKSEKEQAMQEAMKLVEDLLAENGMELKKPQAKANELQVSFFVTDHAGTPSKLIDERGGTLWEAEPDDWGAVQNEEGARQPIRFQGQWLDEESGFYYNRYRYYDPRQGRYITQDPIGFEGGVNTYGYPVNPVGWIDPMGLASCTYSIKKHTLKCVSNNGKEIHTIRDGIFSGQPHAQINCLNNPDCVDYEEFGPIPSGKYIMNRDDREGHELYWRLEPNPKKSWFQCTFGDGSAGRCGFLLHPGSVSKGCITIDAFDDEIMRRYQKLNELLLREDGANTLTVMP